MKRFCFILISCVAFAAILNAQTRNFESINDDVIDCKEKYVKGKTIHRCTYNILEKIEKKKSSKKSEVKTLRKLLESAYSDLDFANYDLGITKFRKFEKEVCKIFGDGSRAQIALLNEIAETYKVYSHDKQKPIEVYQEIIEIEKDSYDYEQSIKALNNIAEIYRIEIGNYKKAAEEYEKMAILISKKYGNESDEFIDILSTIGYNYLIDLKDYEKAIIAYDKIQEIVETRFGKNSNEFKNILFDFAERYSKDIQDTRLSIQKLEELASILKDIEDINNYNYVKNKYKYLKDSTTYNYVELLSIIGNKYCSVEDKENSLNYFFKIVDIQLNTYGENSDEYIDALMKVVKCLELFKDHKECLVYYNKIATIHKENSQYENYLDVLEKITDIYETKFYDYTISITKYLEVQESIEDKYGENSKQYLRLLNNLKRKYTEIEDTLNIQEFSFKIDNILLYNLESIKLIDSNYIDYIDQLGDFAEDFNISGNDVVLKEFNSILDNYKNLKDYNNKNYWEGLTDIGYIYKYNLGLRNAAGKLYAECAKIAFDSNKIELCSEMLDAAIYTGKHFESSIFDYSESPSKIIRLRGNSEYYDMINPIPTTTTRYSESKHSDYFDVINRKNSYKEFRRTSGRLVYIHFKGDDMINVYENCAELSKKIRSKNYGSFLFIIAGLYRYAGDYEKAIDKYNEIVQTFYKDNTNDNALNALKHIANIYEEDILDYEMAINTYKRFIEKCIKDDAAYYGATVLSKIAHIYFIKKDYENAINYCQKIVNIYHPASDRALGALSNMAYMLYLDKDATIDHKIKECIEILNILDKYPTSPIDKFSGKGAKFSHYLPVLYVLAESYYNIGEYQKVIDYSKQLFEIPNYAYYNSLLGDNYNFMHAEPEENKISFYDFIVKSLYAIGEHEESKKYYNLMLESLKKIITNNFLDLSEVEREKFWNENQQEAMYLGGSIALQSANFQSKFIGNVFNVNLFLKGILLNSSIELEKIILESGNSRLLDSLYRYKDIRNAIAQWSKQLYEEQDVLEEKLIQLEKLYKEQDALEKKLIQEAGEYGNFMSFTKVQWQDIQAKLNSNELAVDFISFPVSEKETMYAALLLKKDWENPLFVPLFDEKELAGEIGRTAIYNNAEVGKMIWSPVLKYIENDTAIYFSVAGLLHQTAIEYLPIRDSTPINKVYSTHRLSSMRQLMDRDKKQQRGNPAVLFGGIKYDADTASSKNAERALQIDDYEKQLIVKSLSKTRSIPPQFLDGTRIEVENIAQLLSKKNIATQIFQGDTATETSFKELSGKQSDIIHIATHGFYFSKEEVTKLKEEAAKQKENEEKLKINVSFIDEDNNQLSTTENKAMTRSGLLFAGANNTLFSKAIPIETDDGILTAREISLLDLRGVDLVVLSACQTGLGDITGEGIFGLQRGFKKAGVQTVLMSLWKVDDEATQRMMTEFYKEYLKTGDKRKSFLTAQQNLKDYMIEEVHEVPDYEKDKIFNSKKQCREYQAKRVPVKIYPYKEPRYWASFILLD